MLRISRTGIELEAAWMYETEPIRSLLYRVHILDNGDKDIKRITNKAELKYVFFKSAIIPTNPFTGVQDRTEYDPKMIELSGLPNSWEPDSLVIECIVFMRTYQKDLLPTTKALYNLMLVLHGLSKFYESKNKTLEVIQDLVTKATKELENADVQEQGIVLSRIEVLNKTAGDILNEALSAVPKIDQALKSIDKLYEEVRGDLSKSTKTGRGGKELGNREDPDQK